MAESLSSKKTAAALIEKFEPLCKDSASAKEAVLICIKECRAVVSVIGGRAGQTVGIYLDNIKEEVKKL